MKHRLSLILLSILALGMVVTMVIHQRGYRHAVHQGRHAGEWAEELYPNFDPRGTNEAVQAFKVMGTNAVPALRSLLNSRAPAYEKPLLQNSRRLPASARRYIFDTLHPGRATVRRIGAAHALGIIGPDASPAVPDLVMALRDPDASIRWPAAAALGKIGPAAVTPLMTLADDTDPNLRHAAVYALGEAGTNALPAASVLLNHCADSNEYVRASALHSLSRLGMEALPAVLDGFNDPDPGAREATIAALKSMNTPPRSVWRKLVELSTNDSPAIRRGSIEALRELRPASRLITPVYERALEDTDASVRDAARLALETLHRPAIPASRAP